MARHPGTADGGQSRVTPSRRSRATATRLAALALALVAGDAAAAPADLPPWDPAGTHGAPPVAAPAAPARSATPQAPASAAPTPAAPASAAPTPAAPAAPASAPPAPASAAAPPAALSDDLPPPPRDPNDAPFMRPPNNQFQGLPPRTSPDIRRGWSARRRFAVTLAPAYAQLRLPFQNRLVPPYNTTPRLHGVGLDLELDVQLWRWVWLRAHGSYSNHRVDEVRVENSDMEVQVRAPRGTIHATGFGAGPVFALDLGRFLPLIEVGLGGLRVATPHGVEKGQRGQACADGGGCDLGLKCSAANVCEPTVLPDLYFGAAIDLLIKRNVSLGAQFRYYAQLKRGEITKFPVYLLGTIRLAVRF